MIWDLKVNSQRVSASDQKPQWTLTSLTALEPDESEWELRYNIGGHTIFSMALDVSKSMKPT